MLRIALKALPLGRVLVLANPSIPGIVLRGEDRSPYSDRGEVNVGHVQEVAVRDGFVVVDFPFGQWFSPATGRGIDMYQASPGG